jgi:hypothetical protein
MTHALLAAGAFASVFVGAVCAATNAGAHTTAASVTAREPNENRNRFLI